MRVLPLGLTHAWQAGLSSDPIRGKMHKHEPV